MKHYFFCFILYCLVACNSATTPESVKKETSNKPTLTDNGSVITFPRLTNAFPSLVISKNSLVGNIEAPAKVVAAVLRTTQSQAKTIVLFDNTDVTELYTSMLQSQAHLTRDTDYYNRVEDMNKNGAATGQELMVAKTGMIEAATELAEKEARLRIFGFKPEELRNAPADIVWMIANVSEADLSNITPGADCQVEFISYSGEEFTGKVTAIGEVLDNSTRTVNVRIVLKNPNGRLKPGMYAKVKFGLNESNILAVPQEALVTAEGKTYLFKKKGNVYYRSEVVTGRQMKDNVIIKEGIANGDTVVVKNTMLLKGISFGY